MLLHEFIERTGFTPTEDYYHKEIEPEYNRSNLEKDDWCKEWKKNGGIQKAYDYMCREAANEHCMALSLKADNKALKESMADFLIEQAEKWSASDLREKAIAMLGAREYLRRKIERKLTLWTADRELLVEILTENK